MRPFIYRENNSFTFYNLNREGIYESISGIIGLPGLEIIDLEILEEALELYKQTSANFSEVYIAVLSQKAGAQSIATFNAKHFRNFNVEIYPLE